MEIALFMFVLLSMLMLRIPVYISLFLTGVFGILVFTDIEFVFIAQTVVKKLENFSLLAIPFFILLGAVMVHGKSAQRLVRIPEKLLARLPGGLAITSVVSSGVFGALSGSSISTVVTIGSIMLPNMDRSGYPKNFSLGLITSSAILGIIIPPSIIMIICALTAGVSVVKLFAAGYLPGILIIIALCLYAFLKSLHENLGLKPQAEDAEQEERGILKVLWDAILPILLIFVLFAGIYSGAFTITEASVVSCVFALIIEALFFRTLTWNDFYRLILSSGLISGALVITVSGAGVLSEYITIQGIPERILDFSMQYIPNKVIFLIFTDFLLLLVGTFIDPIGAIMILVPILMPISAQFGVDPLHFCLVITVALGIGYITPPLGLLLYTACAISGKDFTYVSRAVMPTTLIYIVMLIVLTFVPWVSTVIPQLIDSGL